MTRWFGSPAIVHPGMACFAGIPVIAGRTKFGFVGGAARPAKLAQLLCYRLCQGGSESLADRHPTAAQLDGVRRFVEQLLAEDDPVLNTMSSDRTEDVIAFVSGLRRSLDAAIVAR